MGFPEELVKHRKMNKLTQEDLAEKCNVSRQAIAKWEKGECLPDVYMIASLAALFNVTIDELIWTKDAGELENSNFFVRLIEECDKVAFLKLMREHKYLGAMLKAMDEKGECLSDQMLWEMHTEDKGTYVIYGKESNRLEGYFCASSLDTSAPELLVQIRLQTEVTEELLELTKRFCNMIAREYHIRVIHAYVNSDVERVLFTKLGYENVVDGVMLTLPI